MRVPGVAGRSTVVSERDAVHGQARLWQTGKACLRQQLEVEVQFRWIRTDEFVDERDEAVEVFLG